MSFLARGADTWWDARRRNANCNRDERVVNDDGDVDATTPDDENRLLDICTRVVHRRGK